MTTKNNQTEPSEKKMERDINFDEVVRAFQQVDPGRVERAEKRAAKKRRKKRKGKPRK